MSQVIFFFTIKNQFAQEISEKSEKSRKWIASLSLLISQQRSLNLSFRKNEKTVGFRPTLLIILEKTDNVFF